MHTGPSESGDAGNTLQVYKEIIGGTAYVPGRGADMVPSIVGHGAIGTYLVPQDKDPMTPASLVVDKVLFTLDGLTQGQVETAREAIVSLVEAKQEVTKDAVMRVLSQGLETKEAPTADELKQDGYKPEVWSLEPKKNKEMFNALTRIYKRKGIEFHITTHTNDHGDWTVIWTKHR